MTKSPKRQGRGGGKAARPPSTSTPTKAEAEWRLWVNKNRKLATPSPLIQRLCDGLEKACRGGLSTVPGARRRLSDDEMVKLRELADSIPDTASAAERQGAGFLKEALRRLNALPPDFVVTGSRAP